MIIDTSALLAILRDEPEALACAQAIEQAADRRISAGNFLEAAIVIDAMAALTLSVENSVSMKNMPTSKILFNTITFSYESIELLSPENM